MNTTDNKALADRYMTAYYHEFAPTGCDPVDAVLEAIAMAGKAYHCTSGWDDAEEYGECGYWTLIQQRANEAAAALSPQADQARGEVVAWIEPGHLREQGKLAARAGYGMPLVASTAPRDQTCIPLYTTPKPQECAHERSHAAPWRCAHCDYQFDMEGA